MDALGGWRQGSLVNMPYSQVWFVHVRDLDIPSRSILVAHVLVIHNKRQKTLKRSRDDKSVSASATSISLSSLYLKLIVFWV
ncbi:hypothetical protein HD806DRAFT_495734 [Xylariaceae sp. AK1471]|nr:hypothetical protein HD806DRAFT_495734 [Xylariaceae sp. AK1471]